MCAECVLNVWNIQWRAREESEAAGHIGGRQSKKGWSKQKLNWAQLEHDSQSTCHVCLISGGCADFPMSLRAGCGLPHPSL
jgi:hypothetical protein